MALMRLQMSRVKQCTPLKFSPFRFEGYMAVASRFSCFPGIGRPLRGSRMIRIMLSPRAHGCILCIE